MQVPGESVVKGDTEEPGSVNDVQGVVSYSVGGGLGGGDGEVELHHHRLAVIQSEVFGVCPGEQVSCNCW